MKTEKMAGKIITEVIVAIVGGLFALVVTWFVISGAVDLWRGTYTVTPEWYPNPRD